MIITLLFTITVISSWLVINGIKNVYMSIQWKKLEKECLEIAKNQYKMTFEEQVFEFEYVNEQKMNLIYLEGKLFPYLAKIKKSEELNFLKGNENAKTH